MFQIILFAGVLFLISSSWALDESLVGKTYVGSDKKSSQRCIIKIDKIEKRVLVDSITINVQIGESEPYSISMGELDITNQSRVRAKGRDYYEFNFGSKNEPAYFEHTRGGAGKPVDMPAFSSFRVIESCKDLKIVDKVDGEENSPASVEPAVKQIDKNENEGGDIEDKSAVTD